MQTRPTLKPAYASSNAIPSILSGLLTADGLGASSLGAGSFSADQLRADPIGSTSMASAAVSQADEVPVDFFADPDGEWEYEDLLRVANLDPAWGKVEVGALTRGFGGFPEGAAVVTLRVGDRLSVVLVDCTQV